ncbi:MAG: sulfatase [Actinomycetota bacterium]
MRIPPARLRRSLAALLLPFLVAATVFIGLPVSTPHDARAGEPAQPDVVLIVSDDQRWDTLFAMPETRNLLGQQGVRFTNAFTTNPLCCPSRAGILTGTYSHTNGVYANGGPRGGFKVFDDTSTLATWMNDAGYRTGLIGKYLNGYTSTGGTYIPPGWDRWFATFADAAYYDYRASDQGSPVHFGTKPQHYGPSVVAREAVAFIEGTEADTPLFAYVAPSSPHSPSTAAPGDGNAFSDLERWRPPSFNEPDVSDKPKWLRNREKFDADQVRAIDRARIRQLRSLLALDRLVADVVQALKDEGRLDNAMIAFVSDNGVHWGEHRWHSKRVPYEESIRIPMLIRYDPLTATGTKQDALAATIDLAPTIASIAGAATPPLDGQDLSPLLSGDSAGWRDELLVEHLGSESQVPTYCALRTDRDELYVRHATGEEEFYRMASDRYQLRNIANDGRTRRRLKVLRRHTRDLCDPPPKGLVWRLS